MEDDFLKDYMIVYIEDEVVAKFTSNMIIDDFDIINHTEYTIRPTQVGYCSTILTLSVT
jgi:hypothetical protein